MKTILLLLSISFFSYVAENALAFNPDDEPITGDFSWGTETNGLILSLSLVKDAVALNEGTELRVIIKNASDKEQFYAEFTLFGGFEFVVHDSKGKELAVEKDVVRKGAIYHKLAPQNGFERKYLLSNICKIENSGKYTIQVIHRFATGQSEENMLKSNIVTLTVK